MEEQYINLSVECNNECTNWFLLQQTIATKLQPFTIESFKIEVERQINDTNKLELIKLIFSKKYPKYKIESIDFCINDNIFKKMIDMSENEIRHPMITFHGTSLKSVQAIIKEGYIIPGTNKTKNITIKNGSMYGYGIYTSPFFDKAMYYSVPENEEYAYLIVNFVILGKTRLIPSGCYKKSTDCTVDTKVVFGLEQIISVKSDSVIPLAVLKIKIK